MSLPLVTRRWGEGDRRLLLLHGISSNADGWWRVAPLLVEAGFEVVAPDLRGHGESPRAESYLLSEHAGDVLGLGGGWEVVVGHSMGGAVAALAGAFDPGWAQGLVLYDPALALPEPRGEELDWLLEPYRRPATAEAMAEANPAWHPEDCRIKAEAIAASDADMVRATVEGNRPWNVVDETASLQVAAVVLGADPAAGGIMPVALGEWLATQGIGYRFMPGAEHSPHRSAAGFEEFMNHLTESIALLPTLGR